MLSKAQQYCSSDGNTCVRRIMYQAMTSFTYSGLRFDGTIKRNTEIYGATRGRFLAHSAGHESLDRKTERFVSGR